MHTTCHYCKYIRSFYYFFLSTVGPWSETCTWAKASCFQTLRLPRLQWWRHTQKGFVPHGSLSVILLSTTHEVWWCVPAGDSSNHAFVQITWWQQVTGPSCTLHLQRNIFKSVITVIPPLLSSSPHWEHILNSSWLCASQRLPEWAQLLFVGVGYDCLWMTCLPSKHWFSFPFSLAFVAWHQRKANMSIAELFNLPSSSGVVLLAPWEGPARSLYCLLRDHSCQESVGRACVFCCQPHHLTLDKLL